MIEDVEDGVNELPDSDFVKAAEIIFDVIYNGTDDVLPLSNFVDFIETLGEVFHSEELAGHLRKVDPNESGSFDSFVFVRWYMDNEVSLDYAEEAESLVGRAGKIILMGLQREIYLMIHALKREWE